MNANTIFSAMGMTVLAYESGVYHLRRMPEPGQHVAGEVIGLLFAPAPLSDKCRGVKLFLQDVEANVAPARIVYHWQTLDARRLEESGLEPLELELSEAQLQGAPQAQNYTRPDGARTRHAVRLVTGEVVCYN